MTLCLSLLAAVSWEVPSQEIELLQRTVDFLVTAAVCPDVDFPPFHSCVLTAVIGSSGLRRGNVCCLSYF